MVSLAKLISLVDNYNTLSNNFLLKRAFLSVPEKLSKRCSNAIKNQFDQYANAILRLFNDAKSKDKKIKEGDFNPKEYFPTDGIENFSNIDCAIGVMTEQINVKKKDFDGWENSNLIPDNFDNDLSCTLNLGMPSSSGWANYSSQLNRITIGFAPFTYEQLNDKSKFDNKKEKYFIFVDNSIDHELGHYCQYITSKKSLPYGLPKKNKKKKQKFDFRGADPSGFRGQPHEFRLIETHPRLIDSISRFKKKISQIPEENRESFFKDFVGMNGVVADTDFNFKSMLNNINSEDDLEIYQISVKKLLRALKRKNLL